MELRGYTGALDVLVRPQAENARRILKLLTTSASVARSGGRGFLLSGKVVQLGVAPVRVDIVTSLTGVSQEEAAAGRVKGLSEMLRYTTSEGRVSSEQKGRWAGRKIWPISKRSERNESEQSGLRQAGNFRFAEQSKLSGMAIFKNQTQRPLVEIILHFPGSRTILSRRKPEGFAQS